MHPSPDRTDLDLKLELPEHIVAAPELIDRGTCQEDAPRNVPRDAPGDVPRDVPWGRTVGRAKGTRYGTSSKFLRAGRGTRETSSEFLRAGRENKHFA